MKSHDEALAAALRSNRERVDREVANARQALRDLVQHGPLMVLRMDETLAELDQMSDAEVLSLTHEMRDFLMAIANGNDRRGRR